MTNYYEKYLKYKNKYIVLKNQLGGTNKETLKLFIRSKFTDELKKTCDLNSRTCRGTSYELYKQMIKSEETPKYMEIDYDHLQIISGMGHTFIRYNNGTKEQPEYIYIDPTIGQFNIPDFEGIFIGDEADLREIASRQENIPGYKLDLGDFLGPRYEGNKYRVPPLRIDTILMDYASK